MSDDASEEPIIYRAGAAPKQTIPLRGDHITLVQAVKVAGLADTGGQAKVLIREGTFVVNGVPATQPGRKLRSGDRFGPVHGEQWTITG